jgi:hypothetical protein
MNNDGTIDLASGMVEMGQGSKQLWPNRSRGVRDSVEDATLLQGYIHHPTVFEAWGAGRFLSQATL